MYTAGIAKLGAVVKDAGCKQSVEGLCSHPQAQERDGRDGRRGSTGMAAGLAHLLATKNCCCCFDHIKGLKDFYETLEKIEDNKSVNLEGCGSTNGSEKICVYKDATCI